MYFSDAMIIKLSMRSSLTVYWKYDFMINSLFLQRRNCWIVALKDCCINKLVITANWSPRVLRIQAVSIAWSPFQGAMVVQWSLIDSPLILNCRSRGCGIEYHPRQKLISVVHSLSVKLKWVLAFGSNGPSYRAGIQNRGMCLSLIGCGQWYHRRSDWKWYSMC